MEDGDVLVIHRDGSVDEDAVFVDAKRDVPIVWAVSSDDFSKLSSLMDLDQASSRQVQAVVVCDKTRPTSEAVFELTNSWLPNRLVETTKDFADVLSDTVRENEAVLVVSSRPPFLSFLELSEDGFDLDAVTES